MVNDEYFYVTICLCDLQVVSYYVEFTYVIRMH